MRIEIKNAITVIEMCRILSHSYRRDVPTCFHVFSCILLRLRVYSLCFQGLLDKAHETIQQKDIEIHRLKQEVISLRLRTAPHGDTADPADRLTPHHPAADAADLSRPFSDLSGDLDRLSDPENTNTLVAASTPDSSSRLPSGEPSGDTPDALVLPSTGVCANLSLPISPPGADAAVKPLLVPSVGDSGTFDCLTSPSVSSKESGGRPTGLELEERFGDDWEATEHWIEWEEKRLREESERRIGELNRQHAAEYQEMKEKYNDKVESLLQKLTEANSRSVAWTGRQTWVGFLLMNLTI